MKIGQKIKEAREWQNISMNHLAQKCEVSQANLSRIESDHQQPAFDTLERIISALGFSLAEFFSDGKPDIPPDIRALLTIIQTLTPKQKQALQKFLEAMQQ
ncbi:helix-turn-helix transcriptional regulator [Sporomusa sp.]|uniref:helix-turn-helix domain-containing protein n=1 Tax=Sporomusa sp. TaxID=2078658 RepID=UPI002C70D427|nr:helix-turn-helix transcriptional regulator [Sporomusa sp.]HWR05631.1 helix-turn-helix transcriptional regulator [Sporomusa sp.]